LADGGNRFPAHYQGSIERLMMGEMSDSRGDAPQINPASIVALLAILGGIFVVTRQLSSDRPVIKPGTPNEEISEQKIDTRLWEDPFSALQTGFDAKHFGDLSAEMARAMDQHKTASAGDQSGVASPRAPTGSPTPEQGEAVRNLDQRPALQVLAVMIPGGPASEDREDRIRSRFALVSALAQSGYAPDNPGHIGLAQMAWPSSLELETNGPAIMGSGCGCAVASNGAPLSLLGVPGIVAELEPRTSNAWHATLSAQPRPAGEPGRQTDPCSRRFNYAFEWFQWEEFVPHRQRGTNASNRVLMLWLDEDAFDSHPLSRMDLFFRQLCANAAWITEDRLRPTVIGPRLSSTLRGILKDAVPTNCASEGPPFHREILERVSLFLATPRAMDEALTSNRLTNARSRSGVFSRLSNVFPAANLHNFAATDSDLAEEVFVELSRRGVDLISTREHHLVLVSGWDEFFGRVVSAAYGAGLARRQSGTTNRPLSDFFDQYSRGFTPTNLHTFMYFSGIDGEALHGEREGAAKPPSEKGSGSGDAAKSPKSWTPDLNKAEGPTQLDYLGRLGDRILALQQSLTMKHQGTVSAIGLAGGDVYDTLLILQALKPRFPQVVFFTTELDARLWDPKELAWSRNLVVISGYGNQLHPDLQGGAAPFRDSRQTAQYAAGLAALGNTKLCGLTNIPIRHFEIGRNGPVDLDVSRPSSDLSLHPDLPIGLREWLRLHGRAVGFTVLSGVTLVLLLSAELRKLLLFLARLWGSDLAPILSTPWRRTFVFVGAFAGALGLWKLANGFRILAVFPAAFLGIILAAAVSSRFRDALARCRGFHSEPLGPQEEYAEETTDETQIQFPFVRPLAGRFEQLRDELRKRCGWLLLVLAFFFLALALCLLRATLADPSGRPFNLSGTSVWPSTWLCLLALSLGCVLLIKSFWELRQGSLETARNCQLEVPEAASSGPQGSIGTVGWWRRVRQTWVRSAASLHGWSVIRKRWKKTRIWPASIWSHPTNNPASAVDANETWNTYWERGRGPARLGRATALTVAYLGLTTSLYYLVTGSVSAGFLRQPASLWYQWIMFPSYLVFLLLTFFTIDAALLCRWVIWRISGGPTKYPPATLEHFGHQRGNVSEDLLPDWIDVQIVSRVAERVGNLIYYPAAVFLFLILAHHRFLYDWPWPPVAYALASCNFVLAGSSIVILQRAARRARDQSEKHLTEKLQQLRTQRAAATGRAEEHALDEGEQLLQEMHNLKTGAFAGFWGNPVVRAVLVPSGGAAFLEIVQYFSR
jgi:hypothetical protein